MRRSSERLLPFILSFFFLLSASVYSDSTDWYSYYVQCVATSPQESACYEAIRDYLMTDEGRNRARELGFKRKLQMSAGQISSQAVVVANRIVQMERYLESMISQVKEEEDKENILGYCLQEKKNLISALVKSAEEKKQILVRMVSESQQLEKLEGDYQMLLSINVRANEIYSQARQCIQ